MNIMSLNPDLNKKVQEVTFSKTMTKLFPQQICSKNTLGIYPNEKFIIYYHLSVRNVQMNARNRCH